MAPLVLPRMAFEAYGKIKRIGKALGEL